MSERSIRSFEDWRSHFLVRLIWLITGLGTVIFIFSISAILQRELLSVLVVDLAGLVILYFASFLRSWNLKIRFILTSCVIYFTGLSLVINYGFTCSGHFFLFMVPVFATIFFSIRTGYVFLGINAITWIVLYILSVHDFGLQPQYNEMGSAGILIIYLNMFGANLLTILPIGHLLSRLKLSSEETDLMKNHLTKQNNKLQSVNAELDEFLYRSAHDLRSPLTSLLGLIYLTNQEANNKDLLQYFDMMKSRVKDLDSRLTDILNYSRNLNSEPEISRFKLKSVIDSIVESYEFIDNEVEFLIDIDPDILIFSDQRRINTILENLIGNAIKYSDREKKSYVQVYFQKGNGLRRITVKDNGLGIPQEYISKVFDRFFRAHVESTGSGLGLYIAMKTAEKINSIIEVQSEEGEGSEFILTLRDNE